MQMTTEKQKHLAEKGLDVVWVPIDHYDDLVGWLEAHEIDLDVIHGSPQLHDGANVESEEKRVDLQEASPANDKISRATRSLTVEEHAIAVLQSEEVSVQGKDAMLARIFAESFSEFFELQKDTEGVFLQLDRTINVLLRLAAAESVFYRDVYRIKMTRRLTNHSYRNMCLSLLLALTVLRGRERSLHVLLAASLFHDAAVVGVKNISPEKNLQEPGHIDGIISLLQATYPDVDEEVLEVIEQHHECFDGSGFPNSDQLDEIHPFAQCIALADTLESLLDGRYDGTEYSMTEALKLLQQEARQEDAPMRVNPVLVFMMLEKLGRQTGVGAGTTAVKTNAADSAAA